MAKYIFASVAILLAGVAGVVLVLFLWHETKELARDEMDKNRVALKDAAKDAAKEGANTSVEGALKGTPKTAQETIENVAEGLGKTLGKFGDGLKGTPTEKDKEKDKEKPADDKKPAGDEEKKPGSVPVPKIPSNPTDLIGGLFGAAREAAKAADDIGQDLVGMSTAQEIKLGQEVARDVHRDHKVHINPRQLARVQRVAAPMLNERKRKDINYTFTLIDDPEINAFSHLGGHIYLYRGLLDFCADDDMLQYVLGHEIAHVDLKHCVRGLNYGAKVDEATGGAGGQVVELVYHLIALGYSEDQEFDADAWSYKTMRKLGRSHDQTILFNRRFLDYLKSKGKPTGRKQATTVPGAVLQEVDNHFRSHPPAEDRLARLEKLKAAP